MKHLLLSVLAISKCLSQQVPLVPATTAQIITPATTVPANRPVVMIPPPGKEFGAFGQLCPIPGATDVCQSSLDTAISNARGMTLCEGNFECCTCASISCGDATTPCLEFAVGNSGAFGVKDINIIGSASNGGATIECGGRDSCKHTKITSNDVAAIDCGASDSCMDAIISVQNPSPYFALECSARGSCEDAFIGLVFPAPALGAQCPPGPKDIITLGGVQCTMAGSCRGLTFNIANNGCSKVVLEVVECLDPVACAQATFNFIGDIDIARCELGVNGQTGVTGLEKCFTTAAPAAPVTPATPGTVVTTAAPIAPVTPATPVTTFAPLITAAIGTTHAANPNLAVLNCMDAFSCKGAVATVTNPSNYLQFECGALESCANSALTLRFDAAALMPITTIDALIFRGQSSGAGMTLIIENEQGADTFGNPIVTSIDQILCESVGSCSGLTFIVGYNVAVGSILCAPGACDNCAVKIEANSVPFACEPPTPPPTSPVTTAAAISLPVVTTIPVSVMTTIPGGRPGSVTTIAPVTPATTVPAIPATIAPVTPVNPATTAAATAVRVETFTNEPNQWFLDCEAPDSCQNAQFTIALTDTAATAAVPITMYDGFAFGARAGQGATVTILNSQAGNTVLVVDEIACEGALSCVGATFYTGYNVAIQSIACALDACTGCLVKFDTLDVGMPCDPLERAATTAPHAVPHTAPGGAGAAVPVTTAAPIPVTPATTLPAIVTVPVTTAIPVTPATTAAPVTPATTAAVITPATTSVVTIPATPATTIPATPATTAAAVTTPRVETFTNEDNGWFLNCNRASSCENAQFTVNLDTTAVRPITRYDGFLFTGPLSGAGATVTITNAQSATVLNIEQIACSGDNSCRGLTFYTGYNVAVQRIVCAPGACVGCTVRVNDLFPAVDCAPAAAPVTTAAPVPVPVVTIPATTVPAVPVPVVTQPGVVPIPATTAAPVAVVTTAAPVTPATTAAPLTPATTAAPVTPATTAAPVAIATTKAPVVTTAPVIVAPATTQPPLVPVPALPLMNPRDVSCAQPGSCANAVQAILNPLNGFYLFCGEASACQNAQFDIVLDAQATPAITQLDGYLFEGDSAGMGAVVTLRNEQSGVVANIAKIQCEGRNACAGTTFVTGYYVSIGAVDCGAEACYGCTIDIAGTVYDCDPSQVAVPAPITTAAIVTPAMPLTTAAVTAPVTPATTLPAIVTVPVTTVAPMIPISMVGARDLSCVAGSMCTNKAYAVTNPANGFLVYCGSFESCLGSRIEIDLTDGTVSRINGFLFQSERSGVGAYISVSNSQGRIVADIERIVCGATDACRDTTFDIGYSVSVQRVDCEPDACMGCVVRVGGTPYPCDPLQVAGI